MKKFLFSILFGSYLYANSQVYNAGSTFSVYNDINPDVLINYEFPNNVNQTYSLNMFDNSSNDIELTAHTAVSSGGSDAYIKVTSINPNVYLLFGRLDSVYVPGSSSWNVTDVAKPLNAGEPINPAGAIWNNSTLFLTDHSGHSGGNKNVNDWIGGDRYVGIKYQNGSTIDYGWLRLNCMTKDSCYIKDFSHSPTSLSIQETWKKEIQLYPNPSNSNVYLRNINVNTFDISKLKLADIYGKEVKFTCEVKDHELKIDLDRNMPEGCYLLQYSSNDQVFSKKLVKSFK